MINKLGKQSNNSLMTKITDIIIGITKRFCDTEIIASSDNLIKYFKRDDDLDNYLDAINKKFNIFISKEGFIKNPTIETILLSISNTALRRNESRKNKHVIRPAARMEFYPLSHAQKRMFVLYKLAPKSPAYNVSYMGGLGVKLDIPVLKKTFKYLISRHESLRTNFREEKIGPAQFIRLSTTFDLKVFNFAKIQDYAEKQKKIKLIIKKLTQSPFKLETDPLLRASLIIANRNIYTLIITIHDIINDRWSANIFFRELTIIYKALLRGEKPNLPKLPIQYKDYVVWEQSKKNIKRLQSQRKYWLNKLKGELPVLNLPADKPRPGLLTYNGCTACFIIKKNIAVNINNISRNFNASVFIFLLSVFYILLYRLSGQKELIVGTPGTNRKYKETHGLIGNLFNILPLKISLIPQSKFSEFIKVVKQTVAEATDNSEYSFEQIIEELNPERDMSRPPIFSTMFQFNHKPAAMLKLNKTRIFSGPNVNNTAKFDLKMRVREIENDRMALECEYNTDLFFSETINKYLKYYFTLTKEILKNPEQKIRVIELLPAIEKNKLIRGFNNTKRNYPKTKTIHQIFEEQVQKKQKSIAVEFKNQKLSYFELNKMANQLAYCLIKNGLKRGRAVGILIPRSINSVIAELAILKAGGVCLPLDISYPEERIGYMLKDSKAKVVLTDNNKTLNTKSEIPNSAKPLRLVPYGNGFRGNGAGKSQIPNSKSQINHNFQNLKLQTKTNKSKIPNTQYPIPNSRIVDISDQSLFSYYPAINPKNVNKPTDLAYLMYTSGSTGRPKGVMLTHQGIVNQSWHRAHKINVSSKDVFAHTVSTSFVSSIIHWYVPLFLGAKLIIYDEDTIKDPYSLFKAINKDRATMVEVIASTLRGYLSYIEENRKIPLKHLRILLISGEQTIPATVNKFFSKYKHIRLINGCGQCECSALSLHYIFPEARTDYEHAPIGRPISNTEVYILDEYLRLVPRGVPGELCIAGDGLALGYLNDPQKTKKAFPANPFKKGGRIYRTGDIVKMLPGGDLEYLHRRDHQLKVRGYRVELSEIENRLSGHKGIKECRVISRKDRQKEVYLTAFYTGRKFKADELRKYLKDSLPEYMIPQFYVRQKKFPRNPNGKIDIKKLPAPDKQNSGKEKFISPKTGTEKEIALVWTGVLGTKKISRDSSFFRIGGHSLSAITALARINKKFKIGLSLKTVFQYPTLKEFAERVDEEIIEKHL